MRLTTQLLVSLTGLAAVLLISESATRESVPDDLARSSQQPACTASTANVPAEYWFYHALVASHPPLLEPNPGPRSGAVPCPAIKVIRT